MNSSEQLVYDRLRTRAQRNHVEREQARRQIKDLVELLEESLIEMGNGHAPHCDKQRGAAEQCSCGFASLVKARKLASNITL